MQAIIKEGIDQIHAQYAEGKIDIDIALNRLAAFLDAKGVPNHSLVSLATIKEWRR